MFNQHLKCWRIHKSIYRSVQRTPVIDVILGNHHRAYVSVCSEISEPDSVYAFGASIARPAGSLSGGVLCKVGPGSLHVFAQGNFPRRRALGRICTEHQGDLAVVEGPEVERGETEGGEGGAGVDIGDAGVVVVAPGWEAGERGLVRHQCRRALEDVFGVNLRDCVVGGVDSWGADCVGLQDQLLQQS